MTDLKIEYEEIKDSIGKEDKWLTGLAIFLSLFAICCIVGAMSFRFGFYQIYIILVPLIGILILMIIICAFNVKR